MNHQQSNLLYELFEKRKGVFLGGNYNLLIHSVLNTVSLSKLIESYITLPTSDLKKSTESNILKRITTCKNSPNLYSKFHKELPNSDYLKRQRIRIILCSLLPNLKKMYHDDFFETFYNSKYQNDIKSALKIYKKVANRSRDNNLLKDYQETHNESYLEPLIKFGSEEILAIHIKEIWKTNPSEYLKYKIIRRLITNHIDKLQFIKSINPEHFLYILCNSDRETKEENIIRCFDEISDELKHFAIYNLSKIGKWKLVEKEIKNYIKKIY